MSQTRFHSSNRQRGYSLAEVLVATAIFTIIFIAALLIYDRSNKVFKESVESSDMQQSTRVAFDQLAADLRMTGFDYDRDGRPFGLLGISLWVPDTDYQIGNVVQPDPPNGHAYVVITSGKSDGSAPGWPETTGDTVTESSGLKWKEKQILQYQQPDEQLEYMGATAITMRGNLDYESDAANDNGREEDLESEYFPVVTTANDEIVTYALKSHDDSKNDDSIVFYADTATPRSVHPAAGEAETEITIEDVDLSNENPPYTLYRYTLKPDGTPDAGTPLADNIRSMNFRYFKDTAGTVEVVANAGAGQYDAANPVETVERQARREIRAIRVDLVGMNPQPDGAYTNPEDTVVPNHRTYRLESMIVPRNLGRRGMKELSVDAPGKPIIKVVCMGSCNVAYVTWEPPIKGDVITYNVMYDVDNVGGYELEDVGNTLEAYVGKWLVPNKNFYFKVQAINPHGFSTSDNELLIKNINKTKPAALTSMTASGGSDDEATNPEQANVVTVVWPKATLNESPLNQLTCTDGSTRDQLSMPGNELVHYRLYRSRDENTLGELVVDENSATQPVFSGSNLVFTDTTAANCVTYWYRIQVVDDCVSDPSYNDPADVDTATSGIFPAVGTSGIEGRAFSDVAPAKVTNISKKAESCAGMSGNCDVDLQWTPVNKDTATPAGTIFVDHYRLTVEKEDPAAPGTFQLVDTPIEIYDGATEYLDLPTISKSDLYRFKVEAMQCSQPGVASDYLYWPCEITATVTPSIPGAFSGAGTAGNPYVVNNPATLNVAVSEGASKIEVWTGDGSDIQTQTFASPGATSATFAIPDVPDGSPVPLYINTTVASSGCPKLTIIYVQDDSPPSCPIGTLTTNLTGNQVTFNLSNAVNPQQMTLNKIKIVWDKDEATGNNNAQKSISSVTVDGAATSKTTTVVGSIATEQVTVAAGTGIMTAGDTTLPIVINFNLQGQNKLSIVPISSICVQLTGAQSDVITCGFNISDAGAVTPGIACTIP